MKFFEIWFVKDKKA